VADTIKVLGQLNPAATTNETLYTVPDVTSVTSSTLLLCNLSGSGITYRVAVRPKGAAISNKHYLYYDKALAANESFASTIGMTLAQSDVVTVYASDTNLAVTLFGVETDQS
tara:strand:- start:611 stop:946 length:336 start_codon:yes stop_codon:yes gene_type:complete